MTRESLAERALRAVLAKRATSAAPMPPAGGPPAPPAPAPAPLRAPPAEPACAPASGFDSSAFNTSTFPASGFDALQPAAAENLGPNRVLRLVRWPQMRLLPVAELAICARVCALLAHGPSVAFLVHRRLGLPREAVLPVLAGLQAEGCLRVVGSAPMPSARAAAAVVERAEPPAPPERPSIWNRLLDRLVG